MLCSAHFCLHKASLSYYCQSLTKLVKGQQGQMSTLYAQPTVPPGVSP
uniref:Uncharacterized protein n=1 Tax=Anguilla anguilla TaxID=7936 RepID=A0A0E9TTF4_ANGAN